MLVGSGSRFSTVCSWSRTQATVALSSTEVECIGAVTACSEALFFQSIFAHCGFAMDITIIMGSAGARAVAHRQGAGRIKHLEMRSLWLQEVILSNGVTIDAVSSAENIADALAKGLLAEHLRRHLAGLGISAGAAREKGTGDKDIDGVVAMICGIIKRGLEPGGL